MGLLDLFFPKRCVGCGKWGGYVCLDCEVGLWEEEQVCPGCGRGSAFGLKHRHCRGKSELDGLVCFWANEGVARKIINGARWGNYYDALKDLIGQSLYLVERDEFEEFRRFLRLKPAVVEVPMKKGEKGFNQAGRLGKIMSRVWKLGEDGREQKYALLVEDVLKRDGSMNELAKKLRRGKTRRVWGVVLAR